MNTVIWSRLKNFKCPRCNRVLGQHDGKVSCEKKHLEVTLERFNEMATLVYKTRKVPSEWSALILNTS